MKIRIAASLAMLALSTQAHAAPAYVTCQFTYQGKPEVRKFTLNEEQGKVAIYYPETAESQTVEATFTPDTVVFETYPERYGINRASLIGLRMAKVDGKIERVQCQLEATPKRAF